MQRLVDQGWLHTGSIVVADNVKRRGAHAYREFMCNQEELNWHTREHETHREYQKLVKDLVLESTYAGHREPGA